MNSKLKAFLDTLRDFPDYSGITPIGPNTLDLYGNNPLHVAAIQDRVEIIEMLVEEGAEINCQGEHGYTPLHEAVEQKNINSVNSLLRLGADIMIENDHCMRAIDISTVEGTGSSEIAKLLAEHGAT